MCYTIEINLTREQIEQRFGARFINSEGYNPRKRVSAFGLPELPVICSDNPAEVRLLIWGLIPSWVRDEKSAEEIRRKTFNARAESLKEKASYRAAYRNKRCLVLTNGFYEWQASGQEKIPYCITLKDTNSFALAGLYENWINRNTGEILNTFTIVTTRANAMMEVIHNTKKRMPVILPPGNERDWLRLDLQESALEQLMQPYNEELMRAEKVDKHFF